MSGRLPFGAAIYLLDLSRPQFTHSETRFDWLSMQSRFPEKWTRVEAPRTFESTEPRPCMVGARYERQSDQKQLASKRTPGDNRWAGVYIHAQIGSHVPPEGDWRLGT